MNTSLRFDRAFVLALGLTAFTGCVDLHDVDNVDAQFEVYTSTAALSAGQGCVSARASISDDWCRSVQCAEVYVNGGFCQWADQVVSAAVEERDEVEEVAEAEARVELVELEPVDEIVAPAADAGQPFYPNWTVGTCTNDGKAPSWERKLYDDPVNCCRKHFGWKYEACLVETGAQMSEEAPVAEELEEEVAEAEEAEVVEDIEDEVAEDMEDEPAEDMEEEVAEDVEEEIAEDIEDEVAEDIMDDEAEANVPAGECPEGWSRHTKDCSNLPWENSVRWHCTQVLPPSTTQACSAPDADLTEETCLVSKGVHAATWCENPAPSAPLVCGGKICDVVKAGNSCDLQPAGGRSVISVCP